MAAEIGEVHAGHRGAYGRPRIVVALRRRGRRVNHERVGRVMREPGMVGPLAGGGGLRPGPMSSLRRFRT
ncbi:IS3 family transposase [Saccharothrix yanglingensis]|uniref:IS3 family transposase n=1 Tax=Saccharothrix yanglingensis TaxID=659496 RepID=UPI00352753BF